MIHCQKYKLLKKFKKPNERQINEDLNTHDFLVKKRKMNSQEDHTEESHFPSLYVTINIKCSTIEVGT